MNSLIKLFLGLTLLVFTLMARAEEDMNPLKNDQGGAAAIVDCQTCVRQVTESQDIGTSALMDLPSKTGIHDHYLPGGDSADPKKTPGADSATGTH